MPKWKGPRKMFGLWIAFLLCFCKRTVGTVTVTLLAAVLMLHCQHSLHFALALAIPVPSISGEPPLKRKLTASKTINLVGGDPFETRLNVWHTNMLSALSSKVLSTRESYSSRSQFLHGIWANDDYTPDPKGGTASVSNFYPIAKQFILLAPIVVLPDLKF